MHPNLARVQFTNLSISACSSPYFALVFSFRHVSFLSILAIRPACVPQTPTQPNRDVSLARILAIRPACLPPTPTQASRDISLARSILGKKDEKSPRSPIRIQTRSHICPYTSQKKRKKKLRASANH